MAVTNETITSISTENLALTSEDTELNSINFKDSLKFFQEQLVINGANYPSPTPSYKSGTSSRKNSYRSTKEYCCNRVRRRSSDSDAYENDMQSLRSSKIHIPTVDTILESVRVLRAIQKSQQERGSLWSLDITNSNTDIDPNTLQSEIYTLMTKARESEFHSQEDTTYIDEKDEVDRMNKDLNNSNAKSVNEKCSFWPSNTLLSTEISRKHEPLEASISDISDLNRIEYERIKNEIAVNNDLKLINTSNTSKNCGSYLLMENSEKLPDFKEHTKIIDSEEADLTDSDKHTCIERNGTVAANLLSIVDTENHLNSSNFIVETFAETLETESSSATKVLQIQTYEDFENHKQEFLSSKSTWKDYSPSSNNSKIENDSDSGVGTQRSASSLSPNNPLHLHKDWSDTCSSHYESAEGSPYHSLSNVYDTSFGLQTQAISKAFDQLEDSHIPTKEWKEKQDQLGNSFNAEETSLLIAQENDIADLSDNFTISDSNEISNTTKSIETKIKQDSFSNIKEEAHVIETSEEMVKSNDENFIQENISSNFHDIPVKKYTTSDVLPGKDNSKYKDNTYDFETLEQKKVTQGNENLNKIIISDDVVTTEIAQPVKDKSPHINTAQKEKFERNQISLEYEKTSRISSVSMSIESDEVQIADVNLNIKLNASPNLETHEQLESGNGKFEEILDYNINVLNLLEFHIGTNETTTEGVHSKKNANPVCSSSIELNETVTLDVKETETTLTENTETPNNRNDNGRNNDAINSGEVHNETDELTPDAVLKSNASLTLYSPIEINETVDINVPETGDILQERTEELIDKSDLVSNNNTINSVELCNETNEMANEVAHLKNNSSPTFSSPIKINEAVQNNIQETGDTPLKESVEELIQMEDQVENGKLNNNNEFKLNSKSNEKPDNDFTEIRLEKFTTASCDLMAIVQSLYTIREYPKALVLLETDEIFQEKLFILSKGAFWKYPEGEYLVKIENSYLYVEKDSESIITFSLKYAEIEIEQNTLKIDNRAGRCIHISSNVENILDLKEVIEMHSKMHWKSDCLQLVHYPLKCHQNVVIVDLGSCSTRAGILMDQPTLPTLFIPTICATDKITGKNIYGMEALHPEVRQHSNLSFPARPSVKITKHTIDIELLEGLFKKIFYELHVDPTQFTIQVCLPRNLSLNTQSALIKLLLENLKVKAVSLTNQALLTLYAHEVCTAIVVDIGDRTDVLPVVDGFIVEKGVTKLPYGSQRLIHHMKHSLAQKHISLSNDVDSFVVQYIIENLCYVANDFENELKVASSHPEIINKALSVQQVSLKDDVKKYIKLDEARFKIPEGLFNPELWGLDSPGIHHLVHKAIQATGVDVRKQIAENIYISGGITMLPGFVERLNKEVGKLSKTKIVPKVHASSYRYHCAFIGACKFAKMDVFPQVCIDLKEYETDMMAALKKCSLSF